MKLTLTMQETKLIQDAVGAYLSSGSQSLKVCLAADKVYRKLEKILCGSGPKIDLAKCETPGGFRTGYKVNLDGRLLGSIWQEHMEKPRHLAEWWVIVGTDDRDPAEGISFQRRRDAIYHLVKLDAKRLASGGR